ncbi:hypothetical protein F7734_01395 [Scytonema sp. UIC 10036]|uniref:hypothetical protein n=1 Tax=Scytonema sp. UIC 10036 TaxID=2304196 RepID=UPI0012DACF26|nr:hypothetical protein [Scytonema sp. UIC 10036]MUG91223.1 hypothetical protein [Scytonema sp. UIC 10036]
MWEDEGKIVAERTNGGHRRYDVAKLLGTSEREGKTICYAFVEHAPTARVDLRLSGTCACDRTARSKVGSTK